MAKGQVGDLREHVDVDLDEGEVEEDDQHVEPHHVVGFAHDRVQSHPPFVLVPPDHLDPLLGLHHPRLPQLLMTLLHLTTAVHTELDNLEIASLFEPVPPEPQ